MSTQILMMNIGDKHLSFYPLCVSKESQWFPGEAGVPFIFASGSEFEEIWVGVGATRVRELMGESSLSLYYLSTLFILSTLTLLSLSQSILTNSIQIFKRLIKQWTNIYCFEQSYQEKISSTDDLSPEISFLYEIDVYL